LHVEFSGGLGPAKVSAINTSRAAATRRDALFKRERRTIVGIGNELGPPLKLSASPLSRLYQFIY
jgi:hypothetical protein